MRVGLEKLERLSVPDWVSEGSSRVVGKRFGRGGGGGWRWWRRGGGGG